MYKIIGADGKEYGPVSGEQLRAWIREGRANAQTQVQAAGYVAWQALGTVPEFAEAFAAGNPPPVVAVVSTEQWAERVRARDYQLAIGRCIRRGWELVKSDFWLLVGASFVAAVIAAGGGIPWLGGIIGLIVGGPMLGGLYALFLKKLRGQPVTFGDAFVGFSVAFVPLMLAYVVTALLTGLGLLLCLLPGIYLGVAWIFVLPLVIDRKMEFGAAMRLSRHVVTKHWWTVFGFLIVSALVAVLGLLACCVGVFVTIAIVHAALMYAYEDIFADRPEPTA